MSGSNVGQFILLLGTILAPIAVLLCLFSLWSISAKLQIIIDLLKKMEQTKIKFFDDAHNK